MRRRVATAGQTVTQRVADQVREMIRTRHLPVGGRLPTYHELCVEFGASYVSVKHGMDILEAEGLVRRVQAKGTFVTKALTRVPRPLENIGLVFPSSRNFLLESAWLVEIMQGILAAAPSRGDMHIFSMHDQGLVSASHIGKWAVEGVILLGVENDVYLHAFASWGTPGVVVDYAPSGVPLDFVACDNASASRRVVEHLADLGHRRVAYVAPHPKRPVQDPSNPQATLLVKDSSDKRERREESVRALQERGMLADEFRSAEGVRDWIDDAVRRVVEWLHRSDRPTALITDDDGVAINLVKQLQRAGVRVPEDVSVCAVGGSGEYARREGLSCTCCQFDFTGMGRLAVEQLAARCTETEPAKPRDQRIGFTFVEGETARKVAAPVPEPGGRL